MINRIDDVTIYRTVDVTINRIHVTIYRIDDVTINRMLLLIE